MLLRKGDQGADVGRVQQLILEAGYVIRETETETETFGLSTYAAVRQFQANHVGSDGHALYEDGVIGPETMWALMQGITSERKQRRTVSGWHCSPTEARPEVMGVLQWAVGQIGHIEESPPNSNRHPLIDQWARAAGIEPGNPWCALFVSAAYQQLSIGSPFGWIAAVRGFRNWAETNRRLLGVGAQILPGDIWGIMRDHYHGHCGLVGAVEKDGTRESISTLEGNTSNACRGLVRDRNTVDFFVRPVPL